MEKADIIIPVYKPAERFLELLDRLAGQPERIGKIIIINTERCYLDGLIPEKELLKRYQNLVVRHISKEEFDHGKTRNQGVSLSDSPFFIMLTDDAIPADDRLVENLL